MEFIRQIEVRDGVDIGYHASVIEPLNREGAVGVRGINKRYSFEQVVELASKIEDKPNIIIKAGKNAKWYLKRFPKESIDEEISKQGWRNTSSCKMYIIDWK